MISKVTTSYKESPELKLKLQRASQVCIPQRKLQATSKHQFKARAATNGATSNPLEEA